MGPIRLRLYAALMAIDVLCLLAAFMVANAIRLGDALHAEGLGVFLVLLPLYIGIALNSGAYTMDVLTKPRRGIVRSVMALLFAAGSVIFISFYMRTTVGYSRFIYTAGISMTLVAVVTARTMFGHYALKWYGATPISKLLIVDGVHPLPAPGATVIDARFAQLEPDINDPIMLDRLGRQLQGFDRVVIACAPERRWAWSMALKGANIDGELLMDDLDYVGAIGTGHFEGQSTVRVATGALGLRDRALKRLLDIAVALAALAVLAPLMLITALAIKLESPGPVFFVQQRLGRGNRLFRMYKFRSMYTDLCDGAGNRSTGRDDDRITRVGNFIRKTSIDELPQLLNVLFNDMSVVGPRPHALGSTAEDKLFWEIDTRYWHRHATKPGLTGLAQVRGFRGATNGRSDLTNRLQADLEYLDGWTVWRDLSIILSTFRVVVHRNAF